MLLTLLTVAVLALQAPSAKAPEPVRTPVKVEVKVQAHGNYQGNRTKFFQRSRTSEKRKGHGILSWFRERHAAHSRSGGCR